MTTKSTISSPIKKKPPPTRDAIHGGNTTTHASRVVLRNGELIAAPYHVSKKPFLHHEEASAPYGGHNAVLNRTDGRSEAQVNFRKRRPMSAGAGKKLPVKYNPHAARNRLPPAFPAPTKFNASHLKLTYGVPAVGHPSFPFQSLARSAQTVSAHGPMTSVIGFTNPGITAQRNKWEKRFFIE